jgi:hypothetical protein
MADDPVDIAKCFQAAVRQMLALGPTPRYESEGCSERAAHFRSGPSALNPRSESPRPANLKLISNNLKTAFPVQDSGSFASLLSRLDEFDLSGRSCP